ncbi:hypothetical protein OAG71_00390, partial [bacterium]|nr:hypothetical protein [bacterium]
MEAAKPGGFGSVNLILRIDCHKRFSAHAVRNQMTNFGKWGDWPTQTDGSPPIVRLRPTSDE